MALSMLVDAGQYDHFTEVQDAVFLGVARLITLR
jgi:hypothetical protein